MPSADAFLDEPLVKRSADQFLDEPAPSDSGQGAAIQAAEEQQAMERKAAETATVGDARNTVRGMLDTGTEGIARGLLGPASMLLSKEQLQTPLASPEVMKYAMIYPKVADAAAEAFPNSPAQYVKPVTDAMANTASGFTSAQNIGLLGLAPESQIAQRLVAGTFLGQSIVGTPEQWRAFNEAKAVPDKIRIATEMGLSLALPGMALAHSRAGEVPKVEQVAKVPEPSVAPSDVTQTDASMAQPQEVLRPSGAVPSETAVARDVPIESQPEITPSEKPENLPSAVPAQESVRTEPVPLRADVDHTRVADRPVEQNVAPDLQANPENVSRPENTPTSERVNDDPFISRIANRFTQERAKQGEIGEVAPGQGYATSDLVQRGLRMAPEEINQHVSDIMNGGGNDPVAQAAAIRAEEARLSDRSTELSRMAETNPRDFQARQAANAAFQDLTDFHNGPIAKLKQRFHATGMALQGELPVDLSTINGLREKWLKDNGKAPPTAMEPTFRRTAENVRRVTAEENATVSRLGQEIEKATRGRKLRSAEEVRNSIVERMKDRPCRV